MPVPTPTSDENRVPLCIDLDGTLIKTDMLWESLVRLARHKPMDLFQVPFWWSKGRAYLKEQLARRVQVNPATLPYNQSLIEFIRVERASGRRALLVTASDILLAQPVADYLGIFTDVLASDGKTNLRGQNKGARLAELFGERGFDYAGNSSVDLPVWQRARQAIVVTDSASLAARAAKSAPVGRVFASQTFSVRAVLCALRPSRWIKNLIIFVPLLTSHSFTQSSLVLRTALAFIAFSLCASGLYVFHDLLDLDADRAHPVKRKRPFAVGDLTLPVGLVVATLLLGASAALACLLPWRFTVALGIYVVLAAIYFWRGREVPAFGLLCLSGLYLIRLAAGHEALGVVYSPWLLVCSGFVFLGLALIQLSKEKRGINLR